MYIIIFLVFEEKSHSRCHSRNPSSVTTYDCPNSPKNTKALESQEVLVPKEVIGEENNGSILAEDSDLANLKRRHT